MDGFVDISFVVDKQCAVYILYLNQQLVYIGKTTNIIQRVRQHRAHGKIKFNRVLVQFCSKHELDGLEFTLISEHKPPYNKTRIGPKPSIKIDLESLGFIIPIRRRI